MGHPIDQRRSRRADVALPCTLRRPVGSAIVARTVNVGAGGMLVSSARPLTIDEPLDFEVANLELPVGGRARVLRHAERDLYALRFERLPDEVAARLEQLAGG